MQIISFIVVQCLNPWKGTTCTSNIHNKIALIFMYVLEMLYQWHFIYKKTQIEI